MDRRGTGRPSLSLSRLALLLVCLHRTSAGETADRRPEMLAGEAEGGAQDTALIATAHAYRQPRYYRRGYSGRRGDASYYQEDHEDHGDHHDDQDDQDDMKAMTQPKSDYWAGYYDFLINEGSYKFWAVFQLATALLLIYSGFAALYYAKVNPPTTDDEYDDIWRRKRRSLPPVASERPFSGLDEVTFQRILDAVENVPSDASRTARYESTIRA